MKGDEMAAGKPSAGRSILQMPMFTRSTRGDVFEPESTSTEHLDPREISAYLEQRLSPADKERVQAHLVECASCRAEVVEVVDLMKAHEREAPRKRWLLAGGLAAAAIATVLIGVPALRETGEAPDSLRAPEAAAVREAVRSVEVIAPSPDRPVPRGDLVFEWETVGDDAAYRLTVADAGGRTLWSLETHETRAIPPQDLDLPTGETYLWYVDAVLADGTTATTGVKRLQLAP